MTPSRPAHDRSWWIRSLGIAATALAAFMVVGLKLAMQVRIGPLWDSYAYLANAAAIAGRSIGYAEPWRSPGLSILTAPALAVGGLNAVAIQVVDGLLSLSGAVAFYLLVQRRLSRLPAALGAMALLLAPPVWAWMGVGYTDFPAVSLALWAALFTVRATEDDPRFYLAAFPLAMAAVMTRVTSLLVVLPLGIWLVLRSRPFPHAKHMAAGLLLALGVYAPAAFYYGQRFGEVLYPFLVSLGIAQEQLSGVTGFATGEPGGVGFAVATMGLVLLLAAAAGIAQTARERLAAPGHPSGRRVAGAIFVTLVAVAAVVVARGGLALTQATVTVGCLLVWTLLAPREDDGRVDRDHAMDALMTAWLLSFGLWFLSNPVKVPRYEITFLPALVYVILVGLRSWVTRAHDWFPDRQRIGAIATGVVWGLAAVALLVTFALDVAGTPATTDAASVAAQQSAQWLAARDPRVRTETVFSDVWPYTSWYLRANAQPMPSFTDPRAFLHELDKRGVDYYLTVAQRSWEPTFTTTDSFGGLRVLERTRPAPAGVPRIRYLGTAWENYVEALCGYSFYLDSSAGAMGWEGSSFLDAYSAADLAKSQAVAAYGFRWHDRAAAERNLTQYVRDGGVVVLDATGGFSREGFSLDGTTLFDVAVSRDAVPAKAAWSVDPSFAARHPEVGRIETPAYVADGGATWYGAGYSPLRTVEGWKVLATLGGKPAVCVQTIGRGRVYWLGYNVAWHAFTTKSAGEQRLIAAVFDEALGRKSGAAK